MERESQEFTRRHIGPAENEIAKMLDALKQPSLSALMNAVIPEPIRSERPLQLPRALSESEALEEIKAHALQNQVLKSYIGLGYADCIVPPVIQRNILENPGWYTQYTPYQAEIAQGRLEALINFQTMIADLTGLEIANASMLDEATAAAEAMALSFSAHGQIRKKFFVDQGCYPQTIDVLATRAEPLGIQIVVSDPKTATLSQDFFGALLQYPDLFGKRTDYQAWIQKARQTGALITVAADLLALCILRSPGEMGADIAVGSAQRFGVPMGFGGPHAAYFAVKSEHTRRMPGRIIGVSKDSEGKTGYRLSLQTREQHIRRDKATSNICTAQVLLAIMSSMYAVYHGPDGLREIALRVYRLARGLARGLEQLGYAIESTDVFDTLCIRTTPGAVDQVLARAQTAGMNFRKVDASRVCISLDETTRVKDIESILKVFSPEKSVSVSDLFQQDFPPALRTTPYLRHPVFNSHHSETELLRYMRSLESKDLSLTHSMIPLGSCTMKLNATAEMFPVTWPEFGKIHPFTPSTQVSGYLKMLNELERWLSEITGFSAVSLQPNAGSQGEYTGLLVIREYLKSIGQGNRNVCLIPKSAHGTNPASASMAGMQVVVVECDSRGNIDVNDLRAKANEHRSRLAALMITYPSTHGVFEVAVREVCEVVHAAGGQVYMDGANMNALVGKCRPGEFGPDVCHLNLHKTFCIPHGGGGPGMGPIGVRAHLAPFLPGHALFETGGKNAISAVSAAPFGSASILPISWMYIRMMGGAGLTRATEIAILNANYIAHRLSDHFPILYTGEGGWVAHECILDLRPLKERAGIEVEDLAKRLMDYGFHAPTISFPVAGTLMIEPTESESLPELDRFCDAMIAIRAEIEEIACGKADRKNNLLKNAPHTASQIASDQWDRPYSRERAVFPLPWVRTRKFWPSVARIDNVYGDRNLMCSCPPLETYS
jgi:glycine dehydrogenase